MYAAIFGKFIEDLARYSKAALIQLLKMIHYIVTDKNLYVFIYWFILSNIKLLYLFGICSALYKWKISRFNELMTCHKSVVCQPIRQCCQHRAKTKQHTIRVLKKPLHKQVTYVLCFALWNNLSTKNSAFFRPLLLCCWIWTKLHLQFPNPTIPKSRARRFPCGVFARPFST